MIFRYKLLLDVEFITVFFSVKTALLSIHFLEEYVVLLDVLISF